MRILCGLFILACAVFIYADTKADTKQPAMAVPSVRLTDVTSSAGIRFTHNSGRQQRQGGEEISSGNTRLRLRVL